MTATENKLTYNGITFNDFTDLTQFYLMYNFIEGNAIAPISSGSSNRIGAHGAVLGQNYYGQKQITIDGEIIAPDQTTRLAMENALIEAFALPRDPENIEDGFFEMVLTDEDGVDFVTNARVISSPSFSKIDFGEPTQRAFQIVVELDKFHWEGDTTHNLPFDENLQRTNFTITTDGFQLVKDEFTLYLLPFTTFTVANAGNIASAPYITISGKCTNPRITNSTTGRFYQVNIAIVSGEELHIDVENGTVRKLSGGVYTDQIINVTNDSKDIYIEPGNNELYVTDDDGGANFTCEILWKDSYL